MEKKCLRGCSKTYLGDKVFVGNGILLLERDKIFKEGVKGVAVRLNQRKVVGYKSEHIFSFVL